MSGEHRPRVYAFGDAIPSAALFEHEDHASVYEWLHAILCGMGLQIAVTVMVEMAARAAKHVMFADKANARKFHRIARLRTKSAKFRSWSKCAKFLDRANPYYPPMGSG